MRTSPRRTLRRPRCRGRGRTRLRTRELWRSTDSTRPPTGADGLWDRLPRDGRKEAWGWDLPTQEVSVPTLREPSPKSRDPRVGKGRIIEGRRGLRGCLVDLTGLVGRPTRPLVHPRTLSELPLVFKPPEVPRRRSLSSTRYHHEREDHERRLPLRNQTNLTLRFPQHTGDTHP